MEVRNFAQHPIDPALCESVFTHLRDMGKTKNKRIYIGPGRDGSSDDKIAVECKFKPTSTEVPYNKTWVTQAYQKTTWAKMRDANWDCVEDQAPLSRKTVFAADERPEYLAVFIHPSRQ